MDTLAGGRPNLLKAFSPLAMRQTARLTALLMSCLVVNGCGGGRSDNIHVGERDYPTLNSHAEHFIQVEAVIPPNVPIVINALYSASQFIDGDLQRGTGCDFYQGEGGVSPYFIRVPLKFVGRGGSSLAEFATDAYEPGRCDWHFVGVTYTLANEEMSGGPLTQFDENIQSNTELAVHLWCKDSENGPRDGQHKVCGEYGQFPRSRFPRDFEDVVPSEQRSTNAPLAMGPATRRLHIEAHEIPKSEAR